jgi:hypothetical protein
MFEDNSGTIEITKVKKYRPRTKHINTQYHHFQQYVDEGKVIIEYISTKNQLADLLTKSLPTIDVGNNNLSRGSDLNIIIPRGITKCNFQGLHE